MKPTYKQIAENFDLWCDYADPHATMSEDAFQSLSTEEKVNLLIEMFGEEETESEK